jgi:hypothetical protein
MLDLVVFRSFQRGTSPREMAGNRCRKTPRRFAGLVSRDHVTDADGRTCNQLAAWTLSNSLEGEPP